MTVLYAVLIIEIGGLREDKVLLSIWVTECILSLLGELKTKEPGRTLSSRKVETMKHI